MFNSLDIQNDYKKEIITMQRQNIEISGKQKFFNVIKLIFTSLSNSIFYSVDDDEIYNNPNLHSEEQDELEIPDGKVLLFNFALLSNSNNIFFPFRYLILNWFYKFSIFMVFILNCFKH